jgi:hypothetical protein
MSTGVEKKLIELTEKVEGFQKEKSTESTFEMICI